MLYHYLYPFCVLKRLVNAFYTYIGKDHLLLSLSLVTVLFAYFYLLNLSMNVYFVEFLPNPDGSLEAERMAVITKISKNMKASTKRDSPTVQ